MSNPEQKTIAYAYSACLYNNITIIAMGPIFTDLDNGLKWCEFQNMDTSSFVANHIWKLVKRKLNPLPEDNGNF